MQLPHSASPAEIIVAVESFRPSVRLRKGTSTTVRLPRRAPCPAVVNCSPCACATKPRKSQTASSVALGRSSQKPAREAPSPSARALRARAAGSSPRTWLTPMAAPSARVAMLKRRAMQSMQSIAPAVSSSVTSVRMMAWLLPKRAVTTLSSRRPVLASSSGPPGDLRAPIATRGALAGERRAEAGKAAGAFVGPPMGRAAKAGLPCSAARAARAASARSSSGARGAAARLRRIGPRPRGSPAVPLLRMEYISPKRRGAGLAQSGRAGAAGCQKKTAEEP
mmetsp:Transcript_92922/g.200936  ORF Transcript_92922/g.200936 Transcript_92922/m.200936 type:complete len:280 (+) Transcript_92922:629-1468(+)